jgi:hypothetical protein
MKYPTYKKVAREECIAPEIHYLVIISYEELSF